MRVCGGLFMSRNRETTEARLVQAVGTVISTLDQRELTASAVAETAGVDRMLINRYFGGLNGLVERFAANHRLCWASELLTQGLGPGQVAGPRPAILTMVLLRYLRMLVGAPALLGILKAEFGADSALARLISSHRQHEEKRLFGSLGLILGAPLDPHELVGLKTYMSAICLELIRRETGPAGGGMLDADELARLEAAITLGAAAQFGAR